MPDYYGDFLKENLSRNLSRLLKAKGFSQGQLAVKAGVDPKCISDAVIMKHMPRLDSTWFIAKALGVKIDDLLEE